LVTRGSGATALRVVKKKKTRIEGPTVKAGGGETRTAEADAAVQVPKPAPAAARGPGVPGPVGGIILRR